MLARRERILDAARDLIVRDGYGNASMHAIARAAGLTRPTLYAEFADRDELFAALMDREEERALLMATAAVPELPPGADPVDIVAASVDVFLGLVLGAPATWRFVLLPGDGLPAPARARVAGGRTVIREHTEALLRMLGALSDRPVDPELLSYVVIGISETAARLVLAEGGAGRRLAIADTLRWLARRTLLAAGIEEVDGAHR